MSFRTNTCWRFVLQWRSHQLATIRPARPLVKFHPLGVQALGEFSYRNPQFQVVISTHICLIWDQTFAYLNIWTLRRGCRFEGRGVLRVVWGPSPRKFWICTCSQAHFAPAKGGGVATATKGRTNILCLLTYFIQSFYLKYVMLFKNATRKLN